MFLPGEIAILSCMKTLLNTSHLLESLALVNTVLFLDPRVEVDLRYDNHEWHPLLDFYAV